MDRISGLLKILLPFVLITMVVYLFYLKSTKNRVLKTSEDLVYIMNMVKTRHMSTVYKEFTADYVAYSQFLPIDMKTRKENGLYQIISRFGTKMEFMESPKTKAEHDEYTRLKANPALYKTQYHGLNAYIMSISKLHKKECVWLAQTRWDRIIPTFIGLEASYISSLHPYNGLDKLHNAVFMDTDGSAYSGSDKGVAQRRPLTEREAEKACRCVMRSCTFAIKVY